MDGALTMDQASRDDERLVTTAVFDTVIEGSIARGALESVGIRALVPEETETLVHLGRSWGTKLISTGSLQVLNPTRLARSRNRAATKSISCAERNNFANVQRGVLPIRD